MCIQTATYQMRERIVLFSFLFDVKQRENVSSYTVSMNSLMMLACGYYVYDGRLNEKDKTKQKKEKIQKDDIRISWTK